MGPWQMGSLTGAVASQRVTEALKGTLRMVGNHSSSVNAEECLTARQTRFGTSMSAHRILEVNSLPRVGLSAH